MSQITCQIICIKWYLVGVYGWKKGLIIDNYTSWSYKTFCVNPLLLDWLLHLNWHDKTFGDSFSWSLYARDWDVLYLFTTLNKCNEPITYNRVSHHLSFTKINSYMVLKVSVSFVCGLYFRNGLFSICTLIWERRKKSWRKRPEGLSRRSEVTILMAQREDKLESDQMIFLVSKISVCLHLNLGWMIDMLQTLQ